MHNDSGAVMKIIKNTVVLTLITVVAAILLGFVYDITRDPIAQAEAEEKAEAYKSVYPEAVGIREMADDTELADAVANASSILAEAGYTAVVVDEACIVVDGSSNVIGYIVTVTDKNAYDGSLQLTFGYTKEGVVTSMEFLSIHETSGLGLEADKPEFKAKFANKKVDAFVVTKSGAAADNEIDALSGATVTTDAVVEGINGGIVFAKYLMENGVGGSK